MQKSKAHFQNSFVIPDTVYEVTDSWLLFHNQDSKKMFYHTLSSGNLQRDNNRRSPIPYTLRKRVVPSSNHVKLNEDGLIGYSDYGPNRCREFWVTEEYQMIYDDLLDEEMWDANVWINAMNGKITVKREKSILTKENNNKHPELIRKAVKSLTTGRVNKQAVKNHLEQLKTEREKSAYEFNRISKLYGEESNKYKAALRKKQKASGRYTNDLHCMRSILRQENGIVENGIHHYDLAYQIQSTGRIFHTGGGLQACTREMKRAAYSGVENLFNWDLKASQTYVLKYYFEEAGIECPMLDYFISHPDDYKEEFAEKVGCSRDCWKGIEHAIKMGAKIEEQYDVYRMLLDDVGEEKVDKVYQKFRKIIQPLYDKIQDWHIYLVDVWAKKSGTQRGKKIVKNDCYMPFCINDYLKANGEYKNALYRDLAASLLQGRESRLIHELTVLIAEMDSTQIISNEHDGVISLGYINQNVIEKAKKKAKMEYMELIEKKL